MPLIVNAKILMQNPDFLEHLSEEKKIEIFSVRDSGQTLLDDVFVSSLLPHSLPDIEKIYQPLFKALLSLPEAVRNDLLINNLGFRTQLIFERNTFFEPLVNFLCEHNTEQQFFKEFLFFKDSEVSGLGKLLGMIGNGSKEISDEQIICLFKLINRLAPSDKEKFFEGFRTSAVSHNVFFKERSEAIILLFLISGFEPLNDEESAALKKNSAKTYQKYQHALDAWQSLQGNRKTAEASSSKSVNDKKDDSDFIITAKILLENPEFLEFLTEEQKIKAFKIPGKPEIGLLEDWANHSYASFQEEYPESFASAQQSLLRVLKSLPEDCLRSAILKSGFVPELMCQTKNTFFQPFVNYLNESFSEDIKLDFLLKKIGGYENLLHAAIGMELADEKILSLIKLSNSLSEENKQKIFAGLNFHRLIKINKISDELILTLLISGVTPLSRKEGEDLLSSESRNYLNAFQKWQVMADKEEASGAQAQIASSSGPEFEVAETPTVSSSQAHLSFTPANGQLIINAEMLRTSPDLLEQLSHEQIIKIFQAKDKDGFGFLDTVMSYSGRAEKQIFQAALKALSRLPEDIRLYILRDLHLVKKALFKNDYCLNKYPFFESLIRYIRENEHDEFIVELLIYKRHEHYKSYLDLAISRRVDDKTFLLIFSLINTLRPENKQNILNEFIQSFTIFNFIRYRSSVMILLLLLSGVMPPDASDYREPITKEKYQMAFKAWQCLQSSQNELPSAPMLEELSPAASSSQAASSSGGVVDGLIINIEMLCENPDLFDCLSEKEKINAFRARDRESGQSLWQQLVSCSQGVKKRVRNIEQIYQPLLNALQSLDKEERERIIKDECSLASEMLCGNTFFEPLVNYLCDHASNTLKMELISGVKRIKDEGFSNVLEWALSRKIPLNNNRNLHALIKLIDTLEPLDKSRIVSSINLFNAIKQFDTFFIVELLFLGVNELSSEELERLQQNDPDAFEKYCLALDKINEKQDASAPASSSGHRGISGLAGQSMFYNRIRTNAESQLNESGFSGQLAALNQKVLLLADRGAHQAWNEAKTLHDELVQLQNRFLQGQIASYYFKDQAQAKIHSAQEGELRHHRDIGGTILNALSKALNFLTCGRVKVFETDSYEITRLMENAVQRMGQG